ncbi:MAG: hypothetical protein ACJ736_33135 [Streptomyces sp.]
MPAPAHADVPLSVAVSCATVSWTRRFQVPLAVSEEASTLSAESENAPSAVAG